MAERRWGQLTKILSVGSGMVACMGLDQPWDWERMWKWVKESKKAVWIIKHNENDNLPCCREYLLVNSGYSEIVVLTTGPWRFRKCGHPTRVQRLYQTYGVSPYWHLTYLKPCYTFFAPYFYPPNSKFLDWPQAISCPSSNV